MDFDLVRIWEEMGVFAAGIVIVLAIMAVASLAVFVERLWVYAMSRKRSREFGRTAQGHLESGNLDKLVAEGKGTSNNHLASLLTSGVGAYQEAKKSGGGELTPVELARRELERKAEALSAEIRRGLSVLASVGSVAPFVGLLGTVVGIIAAFQGIAREGSGGLEAVSAGIAEALVVTAFGLLVAIPAVLMFNMLSTQADRMDLALEQAKGRLTDYLENGGSRAGRINGVGKGGSAAGAGELRREVPGGA